MIPSPPTSPVIGDVFAHELRTGVESLDLGVTAKWKKLFKDEGDDLNVSIDVDDDGTSIIH